MIPKGLRECRSAFNDVQLAGSALVKRKAQAESQRTKAFARAAHNYGTSVDAPRLQPTSQLTSVRPEARPRCYSTATEPSSHGESVSQLFKEAQIARLAGYCYHTIDSIKDHVDDEGLQVAASGDTYFTRWYVATGSITGNVPGDASIKLPSQASVEAHDATLHVFIRGIMWRSAEIDTARVWQRLSQSWGVPLSGTDRSEGPYGASASAEGAVSASKSELVAHSGISEMAQELYAQLRPHLLAHKGPITLAGHSLGGTLALLVAARLILEDEVPPTLLHLHAFGSPPALSHTACTSDVNINCGAAVRQRLGLPASHVRNWVLDFDPIPRATTAANPYLQVARRNEAFRTMYDLVGMAATAFGVAHPAQRFFFRHVGHVFMLTHTDPTVDSGIRKLPEASADEELASAPVVGRGEGFRPRIIARELLRSVLDHTHTSYANDILVAAKLELHRVDRSSSAPHNPSGALKVVPGATAAVAVAAGGTAAHVPVESPGGCGGALAGGAAAPAGKEPDETEPTIARCTSAITSGDSSQPKSANTENVVATGTGCNGEGTDVAPRDWVPGRIRNVLASVRSGRLAEVRIKNGVVRVPIPKNGVRISVKGIGRGLQGKRAADVAETVKRSLPPSPLDIAGGEERSGAGR